MSRITNLLRRPVRRDEDVGTCNAGSPSWDWPSQGVAEGARQEGAACGARAAPISGKFGADAGEGPCAEVMVLITDMIRRLQAEAS